MFSPSTEMGLTDIEMAQLDYDDPYFDDRQYDFEYEVRNLRTAAVGFEHTLLCSVLQTWGY